MDDVLLDLAAPVAAEVAAIGDRELTPDDVSRLPYTAQVLTESLRLCPPAAGVGRVATRDIDVAGHRVQKGTLIAVGIYALHRDPQLWEDPLRFDPDHRLVSYAASEAPPRAEPTRKRPRHH